MLTDTVEIWEAELDEVFNLHRFLELLSDEERRQARRFTFAVHRDRFIIARAFVRGVLGQYLGNVPESLTFGRTRFGKPYLLRNGRNVQFNVSHSDSRIVCIVTEADDVGIDIERLRVIEEADAIARRFFSPVEQRMLATIPVPGRAGAFLACWTRKEALVKASGLGLSCALDAFDVSPSSLAGNALLEHRLDTTNPWWISNVAVAPGFVCAAAIRGALADQDHGRSVSVELASASIRARVHSIGKYRPCTNGPARFE